MKSLPPVRSVYDVPFTEAPTKPPPSSHATVRSRSAEGLSSEYAIVTRRRRDEEPREIFDAMRSSLDFVRLMLHGSSSRNVIEALDDLSSHLQRLERAITALETKASQPTIIPIVHDAKACAPPHLHAAQTVRALRKTWE